MIGRKISLELENENRWLFSFSTHKTPWIERVSTLLMISETKDFYNKDAYEFFPGLALEENNSFTFFDHYRQQIKIYKWLNKLQRDAVIIVEDETEKNFDIVANMHTLLTSIALRNEVNGGFLVHGIMLEHEKGSIILAGASGVGKTTAATRTPDDKWKKRSDDLTMVVKGIDGNYYAHPWPGTKAYLQYEIHYDTQKGVKLKSLFFLVQKAERHIKQTELLNAIAMLQRVTMQAMNLPDPSVDPKNVGEMRKNRLSNLAEFITKVPTYELHLNKTDPFWEDIETLVFDNDDKQN